MKYEWDGQEFDTRREVAAAIEVALVEHYCNMDASPWRGDQQFGVTVKVTLNPQ